MNILRSIRDTLRQLKARVVPIRFANKPRNLSISKPWSIRKPERIFMGNDVHIGPNCILKNITCTGALMKHPENKHVEQVFDPRITIGNRVSATGGLHVAAHTNITIEDDVMLASNVFMADALHGYENANLPYRYQGMIRISPIRIKQGSWIGQNVVIMPGVTIGEMSIVGANSVVTKSIPDRCIAVGSPARVVKKWDEESQLWRSVGAEDRSSLPGAVGAPSNGDGAINRSEGDPRGAAGIA